MAGQYDILSTLTDTNQRYSHYFKDVRHLSVIDVYRILELYEVTDPCIQHAIKKLLLAGQRGAKDRNKDVAEASATLERWQQMQVEDDEMSPRIVKA